MSQWRIVLAGLLLVVPRAAAQDEARKLFEAMEQKLGKAKVQRVAFEIDSKDLKGPLGMKGTLVLATGNRMHLTIQNQNGEKKSRVLWISDGKTVAIQTELPERTAKTSYPASDQLHETLFGTTARASIISGINVISPGSKIGPVKLMPGDFKKLAGEKVGDKEANVIEYQMKTPEAGNLMKCRLWLDVKTGLPLKRTLEVSRDGQMLMQVNESYSNWELDPRLPDGFFTLPK